LLSLRLAHEFLSDFFWDLCIINFAKLFIGTLLEDLMEHAGNLLGQEWKRPTEEVKALW